MRRAVLAVVDGDGRRSCSPGRAPALRRVQTRDTGRRYQCSPAGAGRGRHRRRARMVLPMAMWPPKNWWSRRSAGVDVVPKASPTDAGYRPCMTRFARPSTTATAWPVPPVPRHGRIATKGADLPVAGRRSGQGARGADRHDDVAAAATWSGRPVKLAREAICDKVLRRRKSKTGCLNGSARPPSRHRAGLPSHRTTR